MAKERISNETLAKVLVKAVEDLQEKLKGMEIILGKHSGLVADTLKKPVPIDNQALEESMQKLQKIQNSLKKKDICLEITANLFKRLINLINL